MGVDYPHVRYVVHFGPGRSVTDHLQQAGRAGRDREEAYNIIMYQGKHLYQCDAVIREVIKKNECICKLLLCPFVKEEIQPMTPLHNCFNRCHLLCKCADDECLIPLPNFDKDTSNIKSTQTEVGHLVSEEDRECLHEALKELQLTLNFHSGVSLFDQTGVITHGFTNSTIDCLVTNCEKIFSVADLMQIGFVSSVKLAVLVLEVFNEVFEDIEVSDDLHELAMPSSHIFNGITSDIL